MRGIFNPAVALETGPWVALVDAVLSVHVLVVTAVSAVLARSCFGWISPCAVHETKLPPLAPRVSPLPRLSLSLLLVNGTERVQVVSFWSFVLAANAGDRRALHLFSRVLFLNRRALLNPPRPRSWGKRGETLEPG